MRSPISAVRLIKPLERTVARGHPWVFRDALAPFDIAAGAIVDVLNRRSRFLARGLVDAGPIGVRVLTTVEEPIDESWLVRRLLEALAARDRLDLADTDALRLVHGEADRLPGLVVDQYGEVVVLVLDGSVWNGWRPTLSAALQPLLDARGVTALLRRHGRGSRKAVETWWGAVPTAPIAVRELGMALLVDVARGQKTGLFLDHRDSRRRVRELAAGRCVLNLFGYTGGFSVAAGLGGAVRVVTVDSAAPAIDLARRNWQLNGLPAARHLAVSAEVEPFLAGNRERFDLVIADPPSFASSQRSVSSALRAYTALHRSALAAVAPGGWYLAASCSSHVGRRAFETTLTEAAQRNRRPLRIAERWGAAADHPLRPEFPEGDYLKVALCQVRGETACGRA
ncbi:MAG: class I SAM-dependent rRNA methyltransferase [Deltaproteobacteria bacterium]|nr:class I SAM-dependent rRNA methyltransferase [Deltaproteobacteria bacterium]